MKRALCFALLMSVLLTLPLSPRVHSSTVAEIGLNWPGTRLAVHAPITILSDADFLKPVEISGVIGGRGTADDPYIIQGWKVDAFQAQPVIVGPRLISTAGILIAHTTAHFVIRQVWVRDGGVEKGGIGLFQVTVGAILNSRVTNSSVGIAIASSPPTFDTPLGKGMEVRSNLLARNFYGVRFTSSSGGVVEDNTLRHNNVGISFGLGANQITIAGNFVVDTPSVLEGAISGRTVGSIIQNNTILGGENGIVFDHDSVGNRISKNRIMVSSFGIRLFESHRNSVTENVILGANVGIFLVTISHGNLVSRNLIRDAAWYAILVHGTEGETNLLEANEVKDSPRGIWILNSRDNVVRGNRFRDSVFPIGVFCILRPSSNNNVIGENELVDVGVASIVRPDVCFGFRFRFIPPPPLWSLDALGTSASSDLRVLDSDIGIIDPDNGNTASSLDWNAFLPGTMIIRDLILRNNSNVLSFITISDGLPEDYGRLLSLRSGNGFFFFAPLPETLTLQAGQERFVRFAWEVSLNAPVEPVTFDIILEGA